MSNVRFAWLRKGRRHGEEAPLLRIEGLSVKVGIRQVLADLTLDMFEGDGVAVTGPNGSGKSSLLNAIAGIAPAQVVSGRVVFSGRDITGWPPHERAKLGISYMLQRDNVFPDLGIEENLRLSLGQNGYERFAEAYPDWVEQFPRHRRAGLLSGGQRQRLAWAMISLRRSRLLMADEPEAGLSEGLRLQGPEALLVVSHEPEKWQGATR